MPSRKLFKSVPDINPGKEVLILSKVPMLSIMQGIFKAGFTIAQNLAIDNAATAHSTLHVSILQRAQINNCMLKYEMLSMLLCPLLCPSLFIPSVDVIINCTSSVGER